MLEVPVTSTAYTAATLCNFKRQPAKSVLSEVEWAEFAEENCYWRVFKHLHCTKIVQIRMNRRKFRPACPEELEGSKRSWSEAAMRPPVWAEIPRSLRGGDPVEDPERSRRQRSRGERARRSRGESNGRIYLATAISATIYIAAKWCTVSSPSLLPFEISNFKSAIFLSSASSLRPARPERRFENE